MTYKNTLISSKSYIDSMESKAKELCNKRQSTHQKVTSSYHCEKYLKIWESKQPSRSKLK